ncbi:helix-turn-helix domain-containing protein [Paenibacillus albus]|uniref:helix-turn-helix domain-containing protein n=1 Tax=Paenibacillus albus TaxID=2495582 RepID=UPI001D130D09|nr:helix-turn-helix domain-containing protein [Paenibacillus albus]
MEKDRDFGAELDFVKEQLLQLQALVKQPMDGRAAAAVAVTDAAMRPKASVEAAADEAGSGSGKLHFAGSFRQDGSLLKWEAQERNVQQLMQTDSEKSAKILAALGHKQRLDILRTIIEAPQTGSSLVDQLGMGTTGQLYHHIKALAGADLLQQEERGGAYRVPEYRLLPMLLLLAAVRDLGDVSDYLDMSDVRKRAGDYLGHGSGEAASNPHLLLWAVLENCVLEHEAGSCTEVHLFLHDSRTITAADNGRGIPERLLADTGKTWLHTVMTDLKQLATKGATVTAPGSAEGINIAVVNAMCTSLQVEVRREGRIVRQSYKHGIPQHPLLTIGVTQETGTSVTIEPDAELFEGGFDRAVIEQRIEELQAAYPQLAIRLN